MISDHASWLNKLAIGTVQFGLDYGISNKTGQVPADMVTKILGYAASVGVITLDTAVAYGASEVAIGKTLQTVAVNFDVISKFPPETTPESLGRTLEQSLTRLGTKPLKAYLAHDFASFKNGALREQLTRAKEAGLIEKLGVSVYAPEELEWLLERDIAFDITQFPFSIFDQRFKPLFPELKKRGTELHTRSSFLQGLFFMEPQSLPEYFWPVKDSIIDLQRLSQDQGVPLAALLLNYCVMQTDIDKVVFGVQTLSEFKQNLAAFTYLETCRGLRAELESFALVNEDVLHPSKWPSSE